MHSYRPNILSRACALIATTLAWGIGAAHEGRAEFNEILDPYCLSLDVLSAAAQQGRAGLATSLSSTLLDGKITSYPPEKSTFDRTIQSRLRISTQATVMDNLKSQLVLDGISTLNKRESDSEPRLIEQRIYDTAVGQLAFHYNTQTSLQITLGAKIVHEPQYTFTSETPSVSSKTKMGSSRMFSPYFAVLKKAGFGTAGVVYKEADTSTRTVEKIAGDSAETLQTTVATYDPEAISLVLAIKLGGGHLATQIASIKGGEGGPRRSNGDTIYDDFMRFRLGYAAAGQSPFDPNGLAVWLSHQTLSYASSQDIALESIPQSSLFMLWRTPLPFGAVHAGLKILYGQDKQSIPEFNASLALTGIGGELGAALAF